MKDILPSSILQRQDKLGFATPEDEWIKSPEVSEFVWGLINSKRFEERGYFDMDHTKKLFTDENQDGFIWANSRFLWKIVFLELWFRIFIDK